MALAHTISNKVEAAYRRGDLFPKATQADGRLGQVLQWTSLGKNRPVQALIATNADKHKSG